MTLVTCVSVCVYLCPSLHVSSLYISVYMYCNVHKINQVKISLHTVNYVHTYTLVHIHAYTCTVAGISVKEHLEVNVVPLAVCLTAKFYQTMQDFFFPKAEEGGASADSGPDHSYLFGPSGAQRKQQLQYSSLVGLTSQAFSILT